MRRNGTDSSKSASMPRAIAPELDNLTANLEFMPLSVNQKKNDTIGEQRVLAKAFHDAGLLSDAGFKLPRVSKNLGDQLPESRLGDHPRGN